MRKKLLGIFAAASLALSSAIACWMTADTYNHVYIAGVNSGQAVHYEEATSLNQATYINGQSVDLPLTVQIKASDRTVDGSNRQLQMAVLQYKVVKPSGSESAWKTVKTLDNLDWDINFDEPVTLFGKTGTVDIPDSQIAQGDSIIIRIYFFDGLYQSGSLTSDIKAADVPNQMTYPNINCGTSGWQAPHVFRVVYSGKRRPMI